MNLLWYIISLCVFFVFFDVLFLAGAISIPIMKNIRKRNKPDGDRNIRDNDFLIERTISGLILILMVIAIYFILISFDSSAIQVRGNFTKAFSGPYFHILIYLIAFFVYSLFSLTILPLDQRLAVGKTFIFAMGLALSAPLEFTNPTANSPYIWAYTFLSAAALTAILIQSSKILKSRSTKYRITRAFGTSMLPTIMTGNLLLVKRDYPVKNIKEGDIIEYISSMGYSLRKVAHRVVKINPHSLIVKGDNNESPDPEISTRRITGVVTGEIDKVTKEIYPFKDDVNLDTFDTMINNGEIIYKENHSISKLLIFTVISILITIILVLS